MNYEDDECEDWLEDEDELKWLEKMRRKGTLNSYGESNLHRARRIHRGE